MTLIIGDWPGIIIGPVGVIGSGLIGDDGPNGVTHCYWLLVVTVIDIIVIG